MLTAARRPPAFAVKLTIDAAFNSFTISNKFLLETIDFLVTGKICNEILIGMFFGVSVVCIYNKVQGASSLVSDH